MPIRDIVDASGERWQVRATVPTLAERRQHERRRSASASAVAAGSPTRGPIADRRRRKERRQIAQARTGVSSGFERGWLTFDSALERRRLAPIPDGWADLPDAALVRLCEQATPVPYQRRRLIE